MKVDHDPSYGHVQDFATIPVRTRRLRLEVVKLAFIVNLYLQSSIRINMFLGGDQRVNLSLHIFYTHKSASPHHRYHHLVVVVTPHTSQTASIRDRDT
eukprot:CCRYP_010089-RA/>CCRYP_010089-RA protein AED:0.70 eAED:0.66 QI:0/0/0/1/1/1/2/0/97